MHTCKKMAVLGFTAVITASGALPVLADDTLASRWESRAMAEGSEYVNIRSDADVDSECVGILLPGSVVEVVGRNQEWTRVHSGSVEGFIRSDLLVSGEEARVRYEAQTDAGLATVSADILHVRSDASGSGEIIGTMEAGDVLELTGHSDGWYEIRFGGETAYVADEFVTPNSGIRTALTLDQYAALVDPQISGYLPAAPAEETAEADSAAEPIAALPAEEPAYVQPVPAADDTAYIAPAPAAPVQETAVPQETVYQDAAADTGVYAADAAYTDAAAGTDSAGTDVYTDPAVYDYSAADTAAQTYAPDADADVQTAGVSSDELDLLAAIIQCEAGGESREGKVAVGACVLNRVDDAYFPDSISDVVYQSGQFTPAMTGVLQQTLAEGAREDCYEAAQAALAGENPIGDLLYFHAGGGDGLTIGNQTFY